MSMLDFYQSMRNEGEERETSIVWIPGENFDPDDPDEMEIMRGIWEGERETAIQRLERENTELRNRLEALEGQDD